MKHQQFMLSLNAMMQRRGITVIEPNPKVVKRSKKKGILTKNQLSVIAEADDSSENSSGDEKKTARKGKVDTEVAEEEVK